MSPTVGNAQEYSSQCFGVLTGVLWYMYRIEQLLVINVARGLLLAASVREGGGAPVAGQPNLYLWRGGSLVFIGTLSTEDGVNAQPMGVIANGQFGDWQPGLGRRTAGVTGNGGALVFMSDQELPVVGFPGGFPNPKGLDEVYLFEADSDQLFCVSCRSSLGSPPSFESGAAAFLPVSWGDTALPQWVSEDGNRVFFDSTVPLVAEDTNGKQDVYEWEREGTGGCGEGKGVAGGCVFLLSGGVSSSASWLIGASGSGDDVFIASRAQLVPEDENEAFDLYDARVGGVRPVAPPSCTGTGCQGVPGAPPEFATPASVTFNGVGDFPAPATETRPVARPKGKTKPVSCRRGLVRKRSRCVKKSHQMKKTLTGRR